jgi:hypothetical protein
MIPLKKFALKRRTFLRGVMGGGSVFIGLPLLDAMLDSHGEALAQGTPLPRRFVSWFFGNGVNLDRFEPDAPTTPVPGEGMVGTWNLSEPLSDLSDIKSSLTVCTGLQNRATRTISHHEGLVAYNGYDFILRPDIDRSFASDLGGPTIDQLIADKIQGTTTLPIHSLQFQVSKFGSPADGGTSSEVISARGVPGKLIPLPGTSDPKRIWRYLFGAAPVQTSSVRQSMLDFVKSDLAQIRAKVGAADQRRMDVHLAGIRALENKFNINTLISGNPACMVPTQPTSDNHEPNGEEHLVAVNQLMAELLAVAFQCDLTRVASVLFLPVAGESTFGDVTDTVGKTHHSWSHDQSPGPGNTAGGYDKNIRFIMNRFGDWMRALKNKPEAGGTNLLDSTIFYASSDCANGHHNINRQPILLGGNGRGFLKNPGVHFQAQSGPRGSLNNSPASGNMSDVLLTCLQAFDSTARSVGDIGAANDPNNPDPSKPGSVKPQTAIKA